jgi:hypothetical protein
LLWRGVPQLLPGNAPIVRFAVLGAVLMTTLIASLLLVGAAVMARVLRRPVIG